MRTTKPTSPCGHQKMYASPRDAQLGRAIILCPICAELNKTNGGGAGRLIRTLKSIEGRIDRLLEV